MSPEAGEVNSIGVVLAVNGEVIIHSESGQRIAESGSLVYEGEELITGTESSAEIRFMDDTLLSQGSDSSIALDDYIYDAGDEATSTLLFKMSQGTFRMVTGKIAEQNPERFQIGTPLATIGIRGTTTVHEIIPGGEEKHGVEEIHSGKALLVQSVDGGIRVIDSPQALIDIAASGQMSTVRAMTVQELQSFREIAPTAIQQEQEIREEQQQEGQGDQQDGQDGENQNDGEQGEGEEGENQEGDGQQAEGGETGAQQIAGESVLEAGTSALANEVVEAVQGGTGVQQAINQAVLGVAEEAFAALAAGDVETAQQLLTQLNEIPTDDDILELIEDAATGGDVSPEAEGQTVTTGDGINWITGTSGDDTWTAVQGSGTDYYRGLAGNDDIFGDDGDDVLHGDEGHDIISGGTGNDTINGGDGNDVLNGMEDNDVIDGEAGDDVVIGCEGSDTMTGGSGIDLVSFYGLAASVNASLHAGTATSGGDVDVFSLFENIEGSTNNDSLTGDSGDNVFYLRGGNDVIDGYSGNDTVSYEHAGSGVDVTLGSPGTASGGSGNNTLYNIDNVFGSNYNDTINGDGGVNTLTGAMGTDTLAGNGGADTLTGGAGDDIFYYSATGQGGDIVTDFKQGGDADVFKFSNGGGFNAGSTFASTAGYDGSTGTGAGAEFIYDTTSDQLWYDNDGSGSGNGEMIADFNGQDISFSGIGTDIILV